MTRHRFSRRRFIESVSAAPLLALAQGLSDASPRVRDRAVIAGADETGRRLLVRGVIFMPDGITPAAGVTLDAYQTDASGFYSRPRNDPRRARLAGRLTTGSTGAYSLETILPGHYGDVEVPPARHIHVHLASPQLLQFWIDSFLFEGDSQLTAAQRAANTGLGRFSAIMPMGATAAGVIDCRRDITIDPVQAERNRLVNGWYRD